MSLEEAGQVVVSGRSKIKLIATLLFGTGLGVSLHDYCHALWEIGKLREILSLQGGYFGFTLMIVAWIILNWKNFLKERRENRRIKYEESI